MKNLKNLKFLLVFILAGTMFTSCEKEEETNAIEIGDNIEADQKKAEELIEMAKNTKAVSPSQQDLQGTWRIYFIHYPDNVQLIWAMTDKASVDFYFRTFLHSANEWEISGSNVNLTRNGDLPVGNLPLTVGNDNTITLGNNFTYKVPLFIKDGIISLEAQNDYGEREIVYFYKK